VLINRGHHLDAVTGKAGPRHRDVRHEPVPTLDSPHRIAVHRIVGPCLPEQLVARHVIILVPSRSVRHNDLRCCHHVPLIPVSAGAHPCAR